MTEVILVNEKDEAIGSMEKMQAHREGKLHRAFSVFLTDKNNKLLLQKRAASKYHSAGLWTNTCCSHPMPNEKISDAATRRLKEELGIENAALQALFSFEYKACLENNLTEHELDHVLWGNYEGQIKINQEEASETGYFSAAEIRQMLNECPEQFTVWFKLIYPRIENYIK
jgi:isopentenyl-diphosphate delta-isomerase